MRLGIFGGSFDPVHYGHLLLAETCREHCRLQHVWLMPAAVPPHKQQRRLSPDKQRVEMLQLAVAGHEALRVSELEIERGGVSYTVDTLEAVRQRQPKTELFLLLGADSLHDLPTWRQAERICEIATPVVVRRAGTPEPDFSILSQMATNEQIDNIRSYQIEMPLIELSSTDLRRRAAEGRSIRYRTPRSVEAYIANHGLYRSP